MIYLHSEPLAQKFLSSPLMCACLPVAIVAAAEFMHRLCKMQEKISDVGSFLSQESYVKAALY